MITGTLHTHTYTHTHTHSRRPCAHCRCSTLHYYKTSSGLCSRRWGLQPALGDRVKAPARGAECPWMQRGGYYPAVCCACCRQLYRGNENQGLVLGSFSFRRESSLEGARRTSKARVCVCVCVCVFEFLSSMHTVSEVVCTLHIQSLIHMSMHNMHDRGSDQKGWADASFKAFSDLKPLILVSGQKNLNSLWGCYWGWWSGWHWIIKCCCCFCAQHTFSKGNKRIIDFTWLGSISLHQELSLIFCSSV